MIVYEGQNHPKQEQLLRRLLKSTVIMTVIEVSYLHIGVITPALRDPILWMDFSNFNINAIYENVEKRSCNGTDKERMADSFS